MRKIEEIIVHCTATPGGRHHTVADIRDWHVNGNGWRDVGYHSIVYLDGTDHDGRPIAQAGSHVAGRNAKTLGLVYVGGVDAGMRPQDTRTEAQKAGLLRVIRRWIHRFPTISAISGHNQYAAKACPSFDARAEYAHLLAQPVSAPVPIYPATIGQGVTTADRLNVRRGAGVNFGSVGEVPRGTRLTIFGQENGWFNIQTPFGSVGWVSRQFVRDL